MQGTTNRVIVRYAETDINVFHKINVVLKKQNQLNHWLLNRTPIVSIWENHIKRGDIGEPLRPLLPLGTIDPLPSSVNRMARGGLRKSLALLSVGWTGFRDAPLLQLVSVTAMKKTYFGITSPIILFATKNNHRRDLQRIANQIKPRVNDMIKNGVVWG